MGYSTLTPSQVGAMEAFLLRDVAKHGGTSGSVYREQDGELRRTQAIAVQIQPTGCYDVILVRDTVTEIEAALYLAEAD